MEVSIGNVYRAFVKYDSNKDNKLSKQELAQAALDLKDQGQYDEFMLFATFLQGGKDGKGLFPDSDKDGVISFSEINQLAAADGKAGKISTEDFKAKFPNLAGDGNTIDLDKLQELANQPPPQVVQLGNVYRVFLEFDADGDEMLSQQEVAQAALSLKDRGNFAEFMLFATFLQGGKDGKGLFPDDNKDGKLSYQEINDLAKASGDPNTITPADFKAKFHTLASDGNSIDLNKIQAMAYPSGQTPQSGGNILQSILAFYRNLLLNFFRGFFPGMGGSQ